MSRNGQDDRARDPGTVTVAGLAAHWNTTAPTVRKIIAGSGLQHVSALGCVQFDWRDVWKIEGEAWVPPALWDEYKRPLLHPRGLASPEELGGSARTARRDRQAGHLPQIVLAPGVKRVRPHVYEAWRNRQRPRGKAS